MTDVILIAAIVVFFVAATQLVRVLGGIVADSGGADREDEPADEPELEREPGQPR